MEEDLPIRDGVVIPGAEIGFAASRSSGPGGQHVNKASTRVTLSWNVSTTSALDEEQRQRVMERLASRLSSEGVIQVNAEDTRSQGQNRRLARERLAGLVAGALEVGKKRIPTRPSAESKRRRVEEKKRHGKVKRLRSEPAEED